MCILIPNIKPPKVNSEYGANISLGKTDIKYHNILVTTGFLASLTNGKKIQATQEGYIELTGLSTWVRKMYILPHLRVGELLSHGDLCYYRFTVNLPNRSIDTLENGVGVGNNSRKKQVFGDGLDIFQYIIKPMQPHMYHHVTSDNNDIST